MNIHHFMSDPSVFHDISIGKYKQEIFPILMLAYVVLIKTSTELNKDGRNCQHKMLAFNKENNASRRKINKAFYQHLYYHI